MRARVVSPIEKKFSTHTHPMPADLGQVGQVDSRRVRGWDKSVHKVGQAGHNYTNKADQVGTGERACINTSW
jgi:hypothetical protein